MSPYKATCFCGEIEVQITGEPLAMLVCHCAVCRAWSAAPVTGATLFKPKDVIIIKGAKALRSFARNEGHNRSWCDLCGGHVLADHRDTYGIVDVYAAIIENFTFEPSAHVNYEHTVLPIKDRLPKFKDFPEAFGGSGVMVDDS